MPRSSAAEALRVQPNDLATIIYTSGTTGEPKGVMLSHDNIYSNVAATRNALVMRGDDVSLSFLPLSHILQRMGDYWFFTTGTCIAYVDSFDLVPLAMSQVRPTIAISVPRLYEKMYARVLENALAGGAVKKRIFFWARGVADRWADEKLAGREPRGLLALQYSHRAEARVLEAQGAHRRTAALLRVGRRAARAGDQQVLLRRGPRDSRGLRAHRDVAGHRRQHAGRTSASARSESRSTASR